MNRDTVNDFDMSAVAVVLRNGDSYTGLAHHVIDKSNMFKLSDSVKIGDEEARPKTRRFPLSSIVSMRCILPCSVCGTWEVI